MKIAKPKIEALTPDEWIESETKFFLKVVDDAIVFTRGPDGKATTLTLLQGGREMPAKRVE